MNVHAHPDASGTDRTKEGTAVPVTLARGDGIGPEIMDASLEILSAAGARLSFDEISIGEATYLAGHSSGIEPSAWDSLRRTKLFFKAPITTPQGGGFKSLNVTIRKTMGLYANVRPCLSLSPFVATKHPGVDVVIVRENEEDLYAGIEHRQTDEVVQCLKLISRPGCEKIVRFAFEFARSQGRKKVSCFTKDNIMKLTDGLFHKVFDEIAAEYPDIKTDHWIIDIGAARLADTPEIFDVIVTSNLYGDIISDIAAQITGSVGLGGSVNLGDQVAMFEAVHGSAPDIAGQDIANPSGLLLAGVLMLRHIGQNEEATLVYNAWARTIEDGVHTGDIYRDGVSAKRVGTREFARAVIERLGEKPRVLPKAETEGYKPFIMPKVDRRKPQEKTLKGVDIFVEWRESADALAEALKKTAEDALPLLMITNRGVKVWPGGMEETFCTDHWRCRFVAGEGSTIAQHQVTALLARLDEADLPYIKTELLFDFDGQPGYSLGQGQ